MTARRLELRVDGVVKRYGATTVLDTVSLTIRSGEVHGLIGRNGAGKSTLVNVLTGRTVSDEGAIHLDDERLEIHRPADALAHGIVAVPQELVMPTDMSVAEVITFGAEPGRAGFISHRATRRRVTQLLRAVGLNVNLDARVRDLPVSQQKVILVAQALHRDARVLILDEPTAAMNAQDSDHVLAAVERLRSGGLAILYISHRFDEVADLCDRVTAMADGRVIDEMAPGEVTKDRLVRAITGPERGTQTPRQRVRSDARADSGHVLRATDVRSSRLAGVDVAVASGEIVGVAGLPGSGVEDLFELFAGRRRPAAGIVLLDGVPLRSSGRAKRLGVGILPASRIEASMPGEPVLENLALAALGSLGSAGFFTLRKSRTRARDVVGRLSLEPVIERRMSQLSGGNQQRVLVGSRLLAGPRFLLLEDPTVGVDVSARADLHALMWRLAEEGMGLLVGSSDPEELIDVCDRIVVLRRGRAVAEWRAEDITEERLISAITGGEEH